MKNLNILNDEMLISSKTIALKTGRKHSAILENIKVVSSKLGGDLEYYENTSYDVNGNLRREYLLDKRNYLIYTNSIQKRFRIRNLILLYEIETELIRFQVSESIVDYETKLQESVVDKISDYFTKRFLKFNKYEDEEEIEEESSDDEISLDKKTYSITEIAEKLNMEPIRLNVELAKLGIQQKKDGYWQLNSGYKRKGYIVTKNYEFANVKKKYTKWTQKGVRFIISILKQHNIISAEIEVI